MLAAHVVYRFHDTAHGLFYQFDDDVQYRIPKEAYERPMQRVYFGIYQFVSSSFHLEDDETIFQMNLPTPSRRAYMRRQRHFDENDFLKKW